MINFSRKDLASTLSFQTSLFGQMSLCHSVPLPDKSTQPGVETLLVRGFIQRVYPTAVESLVPSIGSMSS